MGATVTDQNTIKNCIKSCASARDWRGRWRQRDALADAMIEDGTWRDAAYATAEAAAQGGACVSLAAAQAREELRGGE